MDVRERLRSTAIRLLVQLAVALGWVAAPRPARADARAHALTWSSADPPCVTQTALEEAVTARLGHDPFAAPALADEIVSGRDLPIVAGRPRARLEQRARDGRLLGARELEAASCAELTRTTAFVIVLIVDPDALLREDAAPEPPRKIDVLVPPPIEVEAPSPKPPPRRREARSLVYAGAAITFASGLSPGGDVGPLVALGIQPWPLPLRFEWRGSYRLSLGSPRGRDFSVLAQEWRACFLFRSDALFGASACAGGAWTAIAPEASGLTEGDQAPKPLFGPTLALGPRLRAGAYVIAADASILFPQQRYEFSYLDDVGRQQRLHEVDRVVLSATIGVTRAF